MRAALFDYGAGNLHSLGKALESGGASVTVTSDWGVALGSDALVLPGVGSFGAAVRAVDGHEAGVRGALADGLPCLGICLGMQLLFPESEEGDGDGIGLIDGSVVRLDAPVVPQMGWNDVEVLDDPLFQPAAPSVGYYANSYVCEPSDPATVIAWSEYEGRRFPAAVRVARTWGVQFHPEKSSAPGVALVHQFLREAAP